MSSISGLTVLTLSLRRINLLKESMRQAELPFCKQKNPFIHGMKQPSEFAAVSCQSFFTILCNENLCLFLTEGCTSLWEHHTLTYCTSLLPWYKVKKAGWFQVMWNKESSSFYWSLGWRCQLFGGWKSPRSPFFCITDISSVSAGATSKATG